MDRQQAEQLVRSALEALAGPQTRSEVKRQGNKAFEYSHDADHAERQQMGYEVCKARSAKAARKHGEVARLAKKLGFNDLYEKHKKEANRIGRMLPGDSWNPTSLRVSRHLNEDY
jgi:hypothetical protein